MPRTAPAPAAAPGSRSAQALIARFRRAGNPRAAALIVTLYGDAIAPRGGRAWLGAIARLLEPLGISERLVRTAVFRLVQSGWLRGEACGRRTDYALSEAAAAESAQAEARIYARAAPAWDGLMRAALPLPGTDARAREALRRRLAWLGYGELPGPLWIHPSASPPADAHLLALSSAALPATQSRALAASAWPLDTLSRAWGGFARRHAALADDAQHATPAQAALARLLLIHEYRLLLLRDPGLPAGLLPEGWKGEAARALAAQAYTGLWRASEVQLRETLVCADGRQPALLARYARRFTD
ncbi:MAG: phenylacetic acid degradation operon negative regulatory protein PaaX [Betaproteobacteria bacterium]|nr:phenylacetic acid degradation operon negative regulatory protein PaaX [Betaproteobacteria bacterium]